MKKMNGKRILKFYILHFTFFILVFIPHLAFAGVKGTKHDLSASGPGPIKAVGETQVCIFCHTPHNANPANPLWNHETSTATYTNYWSDTLKSYLSRDLAPPIDGFSKLCLGCHDGTVALGALVGTLRAIKFPEDTVDPKDPTVKLHQKLKSGDTGYLGVNLSGGHPISIIFDQNLANLRNKETDINHLYIPTNRTINNDPDVKLYPTQGGYGVQCTSCHDPHGGKGLSGEPPFWKKTTHDEVCLVCHEDIKKDFPGWHNPPP
jgi:predicted CXXCH cytochrome family protein